MQETQWTEVELRQTLALLPQLLKRSSLEQRLRAEFGHPSILDQMTKTAHFQGETRALPLGILLHVTAGNVFLSSIDSLIMGLLTKNLNIIKLSSNNASFPLAFARALKLHDPANVIADKFALLQWRGGELETENFLKARVNGIVAWGGEEMLSSYRTDLPLGVKLLDFGPKVSFQLVSRKGLEHKDLKAVARHIVNDVAPWKQGACASPQNLYLQEGIDADALLAELDRAFRSAGPRGEISDDEATEILKEQYRGYYSELMEGGRVVTGEEHLLHLERSPGLRPSPLNRSLIIKFYADARSLSATLEPLAYYLQSCSYLLDASEEASYFEELGLSGIKRFAPLGSITWGMEGAPHDGRLVLRELVQLIGNERRLLDYGAETGPLSTAQDMKAVFETTPHPPGDVFSSGGTTGEPKYVHFSYQEFDTVTDLLAQNFRAQGLRAGMTVANLFVAGNLWSSFMAVEKALEKVGVIQLPIGGLCDQENIARYIKKFRPDAVAGIPSMLVSLAEFMHQRDEQVEIKKVFYAGEALSESRRDYLRSVWGTEYFGSSGYASVDAGVIGYQCSHCEPGEHHLFSDLVRLEVIDGEAVVSSLYRTSMSIQNYRTGDRVEWIDACACGSRDPRFRLLGRTDNLIQIWSCRLRLDEIESALKCFNPAIRTFQVVLRSENAAERLELYFEQEGPARPSANEQLALLLYERSRDLRDTLRLQQFQQHFRPVPVAPGLIPRNPRTGKISLIVDKR
jgi:phenylacetate-coenzyme A ligase PaaK-like adenylate-forming protein